MVGQYPFYRFQMAVMERLESARKNAFFIFIGIFHLHHWLILLSIFLFVQRPLMLKSRKQKRPFEGRFV
jgi:hypothetical protein